MLHPKIQGLADFCSKTGFFIRFGNGYISAAIWSQKKFLVSRSIYCSRSVDCNGFWNAFWYMPPIIITVTEYKKSLTYLWEVITISVTVIHVPVIDHAFHSDFQTYPCAEKFISTCIIINMAVYFCHFNHFLEGWNIYESTDFEQ